MITIYGIKGAHVSRLRAALIWKRLEFEHVNVNLGQRSEEFRNLTPAETIPVLQDGDVVVSESLAAVQYLDEKYPTYQMFGNTTEERSHTKNVCWAVDRIGHYLPALYVEKFGMVEGMNANSMSHRTNIYNAVQKKDLQGEISYRLEKLATLKSGKFFGNQFSMADASMLGLIKTLQWLGLEVGSWAKWSDELMQDEKIAKIFPSEDLKGVREI